MATGKRYAHFSTNGPCAFEHLLRNCYGQCIYRPPKNCDRYNWFSSHGIHIADRICGCYPAEVERIIHDGHEKICGGDKRCAIAKVVCCCIIVRTVTYEQVR